MSRGPRLPCGRSVLLTSKDCASWFANTQSKAGEEPGDTHPNRTPSEPLQGARNALTSGKESWNFLGKPESTCANVLYMPVTGSLMARLTAQRGENRPASNNCKAPSKPDSRCHIRCFHGHHRQSLLFPWSSWRKSCTSLVDSLDGPRNPRLDTRTRAFLPFPYRHGTNLGTIMSGCPDILEWLRREWHWMPPLWHSVPSKGLTWPAPST